MVLLNNANQKKVNIVAHKLLSEISASIVIADRTLAVTASIGIAVYPESGTTAFEIMAKADKAMYHCKQQGKNRMMVDGAAESVPRRRLSRATSLEMLVLALHIVAGNGAIDNKQ